jgi:poly-gamma-glutamate capsule biosynthesis protein CapA/YwtB (metallophosphatase superfamily)
VTAGFDTALLVFLCGDVMTGRGIDQILPHPGSPELREPAVTDARTYVALAEHLNGPVPIPTDVTWPWGQALAVVDEFGPDVRLINLETSITGDGEFAPGKAVHYRMHPNNIGCLAALRPDACAIANNHILDFGYRGLADTLHALNDAGIRAVGAGLTVGEAERPVVMASGKGKRVVVAAYGMESSGIPRSWAASHTRPGVALVADLSDRSATAVAERVLTEKQPGDVAIVSVHWGSNWGYDVAAHQVGFAHRLIDAGIDIVHGHSSHHPRPIEFYHDKLILYGCGDAVDDYEGITGYEEFRPNLRLMYFASVGDGHISLQMMPMRMRRLQLERVTHDDADWLRCTLDQISRPFNTTVGETAEGVLTAYPS